MVTFLLLKKGKQAVGALTLEGKQGKIFTFKKGEQAGKTCLQVFPQKGGGEEGKSGHLRFLPPPFNLKSDHFFRGD